jgi:Zn-dependent membrane protease YugP
MLFYGGGFWTYFLFVGLPIMLLSLLASNWVKRTYARYSQVRNSSGLSGVDVARRLLAGSGLSHVQVQVIDGDLTDNYDPRTKVLNLSRSVAAGTSVASEAVVAHEIGHAQQDALGYAPMRFRSGLVPAANLGSQLGPMIVMVGLVLAWLTRGASNLGFDVALFGLLLFSAVVLFQLITTPVELNASHRALRLLRDSGAIYPEEQEGARRMLRAAAFTYWVALLGGILTLLYYASLVMGSRRNN